jgi:hypothetical protein
MQNRQLTSSRLLPWEAWQLTMATLAESDSSQEITDLQIEKISLRVGQGNPTMLHSDTWLLNSSQGSLYSPKNKQITYVPD